MIQCWQKRGYSHGFDQVFINDGLNTLSVAILFRLRNADRLKGKRSLLKNVKMLKHTNSYLGCWFFFFYFFSSSCAVYIPKCWYLSMFIVIKVHIYYVWDLWKRVDVFLFLLVLFLDIWAVVDLALFKISSEMWLLMKHYFQKQG